MEQYKLKVAYCMELYQLSDIFYGAISVESDMLYNYGAIPVAKDCNYYMRLHQFGSDTL